MAFANLRDLGGHRTVDGRVVRTGLVFRSDQLSPVVDGDVARLAALRLRRVFDFRSPRETGARPDQLPPGVEYAAFDILADAGLSGGDDFDGMLRDSQRANSTLGGGQVDVVLEGLYRGFVSFPSAHGGYRALFRAMLDPESLPLLFHCATGKDRTGWAAAAFLTFLGVPRETVVADFLLSHTIILPQYRQMIDGFVARGGEEAILTTLFGVKLEHLDATFDELATRYGDIDGYLRDGLGISSDEQAALRARFLE